jgi:hypothetical protein
MTLLKTLFLEFSIYLALVLFITWIDSPFNKVENILSSVGPFPVAGNSLAFLIYEKLVEF